MKIKGIFAKNGQSEISRKNKKAVATAGSDFRKNPNPTQHYNKNQKSRKVPLLTSRFSFRKNSRKSRSFMISRKPLKMNLAKIALVPAVVLVAAALLFAKSSFENFSVVHAASSPLDGYVSRLNADDVSLYQGQTWLPQNFPGLYSINFNVLPKYVTAITLINDLTGTGWAQYMSESDNVDTQTVGTYHATYTLGGVSKTITVNVLPAPECSGTLQNPFILNETSTSDSPLTPSTGASLINQAAQSIPVSTNCDMLSQIYPGATAGLNNIFLSGSGQFSATPSSAIAKNTYTYTGRFGAWQTWVNFQISTQNSPVWWNPTYNPENFVIMDQPLVTSHPGTTTSYVVIHLQVQLNVNMIYTLGFNSNNGTFIDSQNIAGGAQATEPDPPTRPGFTFAGWYTDNGTFANPYDFSSAVNSDMTLFAKWISKPSEPEPPITTEPNIPNPVPNPTDPPATVEPTEPSAPVVIAPPSTGFRK